MCAHACYAILMFLCVLMQASRENLKMEPLADVALLPGEERVIGECVFVCFHMVLSQKYPENRDILIAKCDVFLLRQCVTLFERELKVILMCSQ